ncbi:MAG: NAD(P)H-binding protein, partial [Planctomycetaceae bacterium]|nr:NAD(P)H-binding protein [Planctomycetaceae bacterium]
MSTKLIVGCGYLGLRVAGRWLAQGDTVYAVTRSSARADEWRGLGIHPLIADVTDPASLRDLPVAETVLFAVGYDRSAGKAIGDVYVDGLRHVLDALPTATGRVIYISSTGVYGECDGDWVDEST